MKKILSKIFIIICVIGLIAIMLSSSQVQAAIQSNPNTHYIKQYRSIYWISYFRNMEKVGEALGLSETIDGTTLLSTSESNNLDSHMIKSTEFGAIAILSASGYGNPKTLKDSIMKTTTGNETGVYMSYSTGGGYLENVAGGRSGYIFGGVDGRYYDAYTIYQDSAKVGDALGTATTVNPGCDRWHSANGAWSIDTTRVYMQRNYYGIFGTNSTNSNGSYCSRGVIVCGEGF